MKTRMRTRILALLLSMAMVMNGGISALASEAAPVANEETGHKHTAECYVEEKTVTCGLEQSAGHSHGEGCYTTTITCGQEEFEGHSHTDDCYTTTVSTCEKEEHTHGEGCNSGESPCGIEEHTHDGGCNSETTELTCGQEEVTGHTHSDACYTTASTLVCTIPETETEVNPITEDLEVCEVCGLEECTCEKEEIVVCEVCGLEECTCEKETTGCICGNEACECENCEEGCTCTSVEEFVESVEFEDEDIKVTVTAVDENAIPANVTLKVLPIVAGDEETEVQYAEVEKQLQEEVEDEETDILGFVAYDITFVDEEGIEVEPKGHVQVLMEYKNVLAPAEVEGAIEADLTVMHLEEDVNGTVKEVVDMGAAAQLNTLDMTADKEVKKAEFETDSFSVFTIVWTADSEKLKAYCVNASGENIGESELELNKLDLGGKTTAIDTLTKTITDYTFNRAYIATAANVTDKIVIDKLGYDKGWKYGVGETQLTDLGDLTLFFEYSYSGERAPRIPTTDITGISIKLYNYTKEINSNVTDGFYFKTATDGGRDQLGGFTQPADSKYSEQPTNLATWQNIVCYNLGTDNYPILNSSYQGGGAPITQTTSSGNSLGRLFTAQEGVVTAFEGVGNKGLNGLLQKDSNGYYYYDSRKTHAQLDESNNKIDIYDGVIAQVDRAQDKLSSAYGGQFLPFDNIQDSITGSDTVTVDGETVTLFKTPIENYTVDDKTYEDQGGDMWFGMTIDTSFYQPKSGQVNNQDMIFEFSGDDDVWVFIDGVKVLDIGGVHGKQTGSINFANGIVSVSGIAATDTPVYIKDCFVNAFRENNPQGTDEQLNVYLNKYFAKNADGTFKPYFKNYSSHEMKFFYLERGEGLSNCKVRFNLPVLPPNSVTVQKEIKNYEEDKFNDVEFTFKMYTGADGQNKKDFAVLADQAYTLVNAKGEETLMQTDAVDGTFKLRHNEKAVFSGLTSGIRYYVEEVGVKTEQYDKVEINDNIITGESGGVLGNNYESDILVVGDDLIVNFVNECAVENLNALYIKKVLSEELVSKINTQDEYKIKITVAEEPYTGTYDLITYDAEGNVTSIEHITTPLTDGIITLKHNQEAKILGYDVGDVKGIPAGTTYKVEEMTTSTVNADNHKNPVYAVTGAENTNMYPGFEGAGYVNGKIKFDKDADAYVTVTNQWKYADVAIKKTLPRYNETLDGATFIYEVNATFKGVTLLNDVVSITYNDEVGEKAVRTDGTAFNLEDGIVTEQFPVGTSVTVKEVYTGASYTFVGNLEDLEQTEAIEADTTKIFEFTNNFVDGRINSGSAVVNTFSKDASGWSYTATAKDQAAIPSTPTTGGGNTQWGDGDDDEPDTTVVS